MSKEQIYDEQISPLVKQIIEVCKKNGISMVANFAIGEDEGESQGLQAMTSLPDGNGNTPDQHKAVIFTLRHGPHAMCMSIAMQRLKKMASEDVEEAASVEA